jgi:hypothetical protein
MIINRIEYIYNVRYSFEERYAGEGTPEHIDYVTTELIDYYLKTCGEFLPTKPS